MTKFEGMYKVPVHFSISKLQSGIITVKHSHRVGGKKKAVNKQAVRPS